MPVIKPVKGSYHLRTRQALLPRLCQTEGNVSASKWPVIESTFMLQLGEKFNHLDHRKPGCGNGRPGTCGAAGWEEVFVLESLWMTHHRPVGSFVLVYLITRPGEDLEWFINIELQSFGSQTGWSPSSMKSTSSCFSNFTSIPPNTLTFMRETKLSKLKNNSHGQSKEWKENKINSQSENSEPSNDAIPFMTEKGHLPESSQ